MNELIKCPNLLCPHRERCMSGYRWLDCGLKGEFVSALIFKQKATEKSKEKKFFELQKAKKYDYK